MVLAFNARERTKDVDAVFEPPQLIRELAIAVQEELQTACRLAQRRRQGLSRPCPEAARTRPAAVRESAVTAPPAEYLLAMKCMAARIASAAAVGGDVEDIRFLLRHLGLCSAEEALAIVARYYPESRCRRARSTCSRNSSRNGRDAHEAALLAGRGFPLDGGPGGILPPPGRLPRPVLIERRPEMLAEEPPAAHRKNRGGGCRRRLPGGGCSCVEPVCGRPAAAVERGTGRALRHPWFAHRGGALRATLILESPAAFRERNLFVSENALSRA